jgi:MoaA/NifB/PqqE/SkfB family radical SAM enzyme
MFAQPLYQSYRRYRSLQTHRISALPILILMPHSACNCRCLICDIWKDNKNLQQLKEEDIQGLLNSIETLGTQQVVMSGGEALLNSRLFDLCALLKTKGVHITLLSTGLLLDRYAHEVLQWVDDIIVSLDGDEATHDYIRNTPGAFRKLKDGVRRIKNLRPEYPITGRTVIHKSNFRIWPAIVRTAAAIGLDRISFLAADTTSHAFNRQQPWGMERQLEVLPAEEELPALKEALNNLIREEQASFTSGFIAESPAKLRSIHDYYSAAYGHNPYPAKKCNAPWVSAVVEANGDVRPCFFHETVGNIHQQGLQTILNGEKAYQFRRNLDMDCNSTCQKCVCYLNLSPFTPIV